MTTVERSTFVAVCMETNDLKGKDVERVKTLNAILNPKELSKIVDFLPAWSMGEGKFNRIAPLYALCAKAITTTMLRAYRPGLTVCLARENGSFLTIKNFPKGMSRNEWMRFTETLDDQLIGSIPVETIPVSHGVVSSHFIDGEFQWTQVDVQSWATQDNSPGYNYNLLAFKEEHLDEEVLWIMNYVGAISRIVEYLLKIQSPDVCSLLQAIALDRMHICWKDKREQVAKEFSALIARMDPELKAEFDIPDSL